MLLSLTLRRAKAISSPYPPFPAGMLTSLLHRPTEPSKLLSHITLHSLLTHWHHKVFGPILSAPEISISRTASRETLREAILSFSRPKWRRTQWEGRGKSLRF